MNREKWYEFTNSRRRDVPVEDVPGDGMRSNASHPRGAELVVVVTRNRMGKNQDKYNEKLWDAIRAGVDARSAEARLGRSEPQKFGAVVIVVKIGGSLYDHPGLGPGLRAFFDTLPPAPVLLVPGGGDFADAVRKLDTVHQLGEEAAHWLALDAMRAAGALLEVLLRREFLFLESRVTICDCRAFAAADEQRPGHLPHLWAVTSDSIAARIAAVSHADRLILLKSVDVPPGTPWAEAAARGWVDPHFPDLVAGQSFRVEVVNFRRWITGPS